MLVSALPSCLHLPPSLSHFQHEFGIVISTLLADPSLINTQSIGPFLLLLLVLQSTDSGAILKGDTARAKC